MQRAVVFWTVFLAAVVTVASAGTPNIALGPDGALYRLDTVDGQLVLTVERSEEEIDVVPVPQTTGIEAAELLLDIDPATGTLVAAWEETLSEDLAQIALATWKDGTWYGPVIVAGGTGEVAVHPSLLIHDTKLTMTDEDGNTVLAGIESRIHMAWWQDPDAEDGGSAYYATTILDENGVPEMESWAPVSMGSLAPWGSGCSLGDNVPGLTYPRLFVDVQSGDPHLIFTDLPSCMFGIVRLLGEPEEGEDDTVTSQRRRNVIVFGLQKMVFIEPGLPLNNTDFEVGHNLSIVLYWVDDDAVNYITLDEDSWSEIKSLRLGDHLSREDAVNLVRGLAH